MSQRNVLPGDKLGVIEEYEPGEGAAALEGVVRSLSVGEPIFDVKRHVVSVSKARPIKSIPRPGDSVIGPVESLQSSIANLLIRYVNDRENRSSFTAMLSLRPKGPPRGRQRKTTVCRPGDWLRATVASDKNSILQLSLDGPNDGVIHATCSNCGGPVDGDNNRIRCRLCGALDERKLAPDFGLV